VRSGAYTRSRTRNYNISQPKNGKPASIELGGIASYDKVIQVYETAGIPYKFNLNTTVQVNSYERYVNFDGLLSTFSLTMPHFMLLNNWHVTYHALIKAFALSMSNGKSSIFSTTTARAKILARVIVLVWTISYFVIMVIVILNILISWFFEIYSKHFNKEHELIQYRNTVMELHKNDLYVAHHDQDHHVLHNSEVERSISRIFKTLRRPIRQPVCHVTHIQFSKPLFCNTHCNLVTCDVCLRPTRLSTPCGVGSCKYACRLLCTASRRSLENEHALPRIQWLIAPKFVHVVLQNQEPSHPVLNVSLPPHLKKDGPFLIPITDSIWEPIKVCRLCYHFYNKFNLFDDDTTITRGTVIRPAETTRNYRQTKYIDETYDKDTKNPFDGDKSSVEIANPMNDSNGNSNNSNNDSNNDSNCNNNNLNIGMVSSMKNGDDEQRV
jgi:hypothetical protein